MPWLFGWSILDDPDFNKTFDVALHVGTLVGALVYFRKDVWHYIKAFFASVGHRSIQSTDERLAWALILGTIPAVIVGATLEELIQDTLGAPWMIAVSLAIFGVILWIVDRRAPVTKPYDSLKPRHGLILGSAQALALQPGVSRSGITITAGRLLGLDRESAARFSFLLSLPIIFGAGLYKGMGVVRDGIPPSMVSPFFWGFVSAAVSGFLTIWLLLAYLRKRDFTVFMIYRLVIAAIAIAIMLLEIRPPTL